MVISPFASRAQKVPKAMQLTTTKKDGGDENATNHHHRGRPAKVVVPPHRKSRFGALRRALSPSRGCARHENNDGNRMVDVVTDEDDEGKNTGIPLVSPVTPSTPSSSQSQNKSRLDDTSTPPMIHQPTAAHATYWVHPQQYNTQAILSRETTAAAAAGLRYNVDRGRASLDDSMKQQFARYVHQKKTGPPPENATTCSPTSVPGRKIFVLLLEPQRKLFELIQLVFDARTATIGSIITMIPYNVTEPALITAYAGLTRPQHRATPWTDWHAPADEIQPGEILVAIPQHCADNVRYIVKLAKHILGNERIQKLLAAAEPLQMKKTTSRRGRSSSSSSSAKNRVLRSLSPLRSRRGRKSRAMATVDEHNHHDLDQDGSLAAQFLPHVMDNDLAAHNDGATHVVSPLSSTRSMSAMSAMDMDDDTTTVPSSPAVVQGTYDDNSTLADSYSSWSRSLDYSMTRQRMAYRMEQQKAALDAEITTEHGHPRRRRRPTKWRRAMTMQRMAMLCVVVGVAILLLTRRLGHDAPTAAAAAAARTSRPPQPLGVTGTLQLVLVFGLLVKLQRYWSMMPHNQNNTRCSFLNVVHSAPSRNRAERERAVHSSRTTAKRQRRSAKQIV